MSAADGMQRTPAAPMHVTFARIHPVEVAHGGAQRHGDDAPAPQRHHVIKSFLGDQVHHPHPEAGGEDTVEGDGGTAALQVPHRHHLLPILQEGPFRHHHDGEAAAPLHPLADGGADRTHRTGNGCAMYN